MDKQIFKKNIEELTGETKQNKIANILNISESKVSKWFSGTLLPTLEDLLSISQKYNCSIDWLIGHENQIDISVYDVCKLLVLLDSKLYLTIETNIVEETYYHHLKPDPLTLKETRSNILFCNSFNSLNEHQLGIDGYDASDALSQGHGDSIIREHVEINNFLERYTKLKEAFFQNYIDEESFKHMIECFLSGLSKEPIKYFYEHEIADELPFSN